MRIDGSRNACFLLVYLIGCALSITRIPAQAVQKIYINPKSSAIQKQTAFIDSLRFTPFESVAGTAMNEFAALRVTDKYYLATDFNAGVLFIYAKSGALIRKLEFNSSVKNIFPSYNDQTNQLVFFANNKNYSLTSRDRVKIKLDWDKPRNLKYFKKYVIDLNDTAFVIAEAKPSKYDLIDARPVFDNQYIQTGITTSPLYKDSSGYEVSIYESGKLLRSYFPYNQVNEPKFMFTEEQVAVSSAATPDVCYLGRPFCDTIYKLEKYSLSPVYQLVLPLENVIPAAFFTDGSLTKTDRQNLIRNNGWAFQQVRDFYETSRYVYLAMGFFTHFERYVYDKQSKITYSAAKIKADSPQYDLSLFSGYNATRVGNRFYKLVNAGMLASFFSQHPDTTVPKELAAVINNRPDKTRLVLVEFTLKN